MNSVPEIETAIERLNRDELSTLRQWFLDFDAAMWDQQFADDVKSGRLDALADEALRDLREGRSTDL